MTNSETAQVLADDRTKGSHSAGPWTCFYKHKYNEWHVGVSVSSGGMKLALFPDGCPTENPEADSHLIAAAPDLLEALQKAADTLGDIATALNIFGKSTAAEACRIAEKASRDVIAKAEGK